jgi:hypothetical protein
MAEYLTRRQATAYLDKKGETVSGSYLATAATSGTGPLFRYLGTHPVYTAKDLDAWIETRKRSRLEAFLQFSRLRLGPLTRTSHPRRPRKLREQAREERA